MSIIERTNNLSKYGKPLLNGDILPHGNLAQDLTTCYLLNSSPSNYLIDHSLYRHSSSRIQNLTNNYWIPTNDGYILFLFEAAAQRVDCGFIPKLNGSDKATIAIWIKKQNIGTRASVGKGGFNLDVMDDGFTYLGMDGVYGRFPNDEVVPEWQHIVFTFDGVKSNSQRLRGYKDGIEQPLEVNGTLPTHINSDSFNFFYLNYSTEFGVYGGAYYKFVGMWNRILSPQEILQLYTDQQYSWLTQSKRIKTSHLLSMPEPPEPLPAITELVDLYTPLPMNMDCGIYWITDYDAGILI